MGIKHFFGWFKNNFSNNIKNLRKNQTFDTIGVSVDNLMIDLNGLFHSSTQKVYEYGSYKPPVSLMGRNQKRKKIGSLKQQIKVFEDICNNIEKLFLLVSPKKRLILCVDGPAPLSKQNQQRQRRFRSASEKDDEEFKRFDSNCITPGTKFMDYLTKYIDWYIKLNISKNPKWRDIDVVFSNEKSPGEGEHKIINYIRFYGDPDDSYCIHGLDADLIMLALATHLPKFWILREDLYNPRNEFNIIDIGSTIDSITEIMNWTDEDTKEFIPEYAINDFIFICFMVGNDFLPHIPSLEIIEGGIELMMNVYRNVGKQYGHLTTKLNDEIIFKKTPMKFFLGIISQYDKENFENKLLHKDTFFPDYLLEKHANFIDEKYNLDIEKYRSDYYKECFSEDVNIKDLCHEYFIGMQWVLSYYTRGVPDWKWCFKHHYAPFAYELSENVEDFVFADKNVTYPMTPFQQLLSVLPPKSSSLLPEPLCKLLTDSDSKLKEFCPDKFNVDLSGKRKEWEGIVILPIVNFSVVREEYFKYIGKVSRLDLSRNILGNSFIYRYNSEVNENFRSYYGDIQECKVKTTIIDI